MPLPQTSPPRLMKVQADLILLQLFERFEHIGGGAERAIKFRGDNNITRTGAPAGAADLQDDPREARSRTRRPR
jgi:hypothetical protein